ncbi:MAG: tRNA (guanosine(37)-N1)-methyltransferase TrmD [Desulfobulbus propionicus]|nr:MAG: tRNA (guanosine(37)-N1)-methyltransferase TrmD [Desulfobulbus propionicus]
MFFDILTIFPDFFHSPLQEGIIRRAAARKQITVRLHNIRDYAPDRHHMTDDRPFGGGEGMVMKPEPLAGCLNDIARKDSCRVIFLSPRGKTFTQEKARELAGISQLILVCGRYEGVDQRFIELYVDEELSIGDYVLTGGELAAMVLVDSISRLLPGVLGCHDSAVNDTFSRSLLKHHQYTRPRLFAGKKVPEVLLEGNHEEIRHYRFVESVRLTGKYRPDLLQNVAFTEEERKLLFAEGIDLDQR